jgi:hypothetical protein
LVLQEYTPRTQKKQRQQSEAAVVLAKKRRERKQQEIEKERLLDLYQGGQVELAEIEPRLKTIRTKIKKLQDECALVEREAKEAHHRLQLIEQFSAFTQRMTANLSTLSFAERKQIIRLLVEEVVVDTTTEEITVRQILPVEQMFPLCKRSNNPPLRDPRRGRVQGALVDDPTAQPFRQDALVHGRVLFDPRQRDRVEKALDVPFQDSRGGVFLPHCLKALLDRIRAPALGPKPLGVGVGLGFGNWLQRLMKFEEQNR